MKSFLILASPLVTLAASIPLRAIVNSAWTAGVWRQSSDSGPAFTGNGVNASDGKFFLNKDTSAYCPSDVTDLNCSEFPGGKTVFLGGNGTVSLGVAVPGGQQVYVASDGSLSYTTPHSAYIPEGSNTTGFSREVSAVSGAPTILGMQGRNWCICPTAGTFATNSTAQVYQVYLANGTKDDCLGFSMRTYAATDIVAWEYA